MAEVICCAKLWLGLRHEATVLRVVNVFDRVVCHVSRAAALQWHELCGSCCSSCCGTMAHYHTTGDTE